MDITILCSSVSHPVNDTLTEWMQNNREKHQIHLVHSVKDLTGGDLLFLISCAEIISKELRDKYQKTLIIHSSDLPQGRGWSPHIWGIIEGKTEIVSSLLEAEDKVDTGDIWKKIKVKIPKSCLSEEINQLLFDTLKQLMDFAVNNFSIIIPVAQKGQSSHYRKRTPEDSELDVDKTIKEQFDLLRVCDVDRFPAFFELYGCKYRIEITKLGGEHEKN